MLGYRIVQPKYVECTSDYPKYILCAIFQYLVLYYNVLNILLMVSLFVPSNILKCTELGKEVLLYREN